MPRVSAASFGEARLRMLRIVRRGDRHDPHDLTVSCRYEGHFEEVGAEGRSDGPLPGEALKNLIHRSARAVGAGEIETLGLTICDAMLSAHPEVTRTRLEIAEQPWNRLEAGGKALGQVFLAGSPERRTTAVTSNGRQVAVVSGIEHLTLLRSSGFGPLRQADEDPDGFDDPLPRVLVASLSARWTYTSADVTFGPFRQGIRAAIVETLGLYARRSMRHTLYAIADVVLASFQDIAEVSLIAQERPCSPADPFATGPDNLDDLFTAAEEPLATTEVTVERG